MKTTSSPDIGSKFRPWRRDRRRLLLRRRHAADETWRPLECVRECAILASTRISRNVARIAWWRFGGRSTSFRASARETVAQCALARCHDPTSCGCESQMLHSRTAKRSHRNSCSIKLRFLTKTIFELFKIHGAVPVLVDLIDHLLHLGLGRCILAEPVQDGEPLVGRD